MYTKPSLRIVLKSCMPIGYFIISCFDLQIYFFLMIRTNIHLISFIKKKCVAKQCLSYPSCSQQYFSLSYFHLVFCQEMTLFSLRC